MVITWWKNKRQRPGPSRWETVTGLWSIPRRKTTGSEWRIRGWGIRGLGPCVIPCPMCVWADNSHGQCWFHDALYNDLGWLWILYLCDQWYFCGLNIMYLPGYAQHECKCILSLFTCLVTVTCRILMLTWYWQNSVYIQGAFCMFYIWPVLYMEVAWKELKAEMSFNVEVHHELYVSDFKLNQCFLLKLDREHFM